MKIKVVILTSVGPVTGTDREITQDEVGVLHDGLKELMSNKLNYLELETEQGWAIVPGDKIHAVQISVIEP